MCYFQHDSPMLYTLCRLDRIKQSNKLRTFTACVRSLGDIELYPGIKGEDRTKLPVMRKQGNHGK